MEEWAKVVSYARGDKRRRTQGGSERCRAPVAAGCDLELRRAGLQQIYDGSYPTRVVGSERR